MDLFYRLAADGVVVFHLSFVAFAGLGGLWALRRPRIAWLHLPAVGWAVLVETLGWYCPLTDLENGLRLRAGLGGYEGDFVGRYILPILYPVGLTRETQWVLAAVLLAFNLAVYSWLIRHWRRGR